MRASKNPQTLNVILAMVLGAAVVASLWVNSSFTNAQATADGVPAAARLGVPFDLGYGESVQVAGSDIEITFVNVTEDSRCPSDVTCVWAGQVSVMFGLAQAGSDLGSVVLTVGAGSNSSSAERQVGEYVLKLVDVRPYPVSTSSISLSDYVATVELSKGDGSVESRSVLVMAIGGNDTQSPTMTKFISGWSFEREIGVAIFVMRDAGSLERIVARFVPFEADCTHDSSECFDGQITRISGNAGIEEGDFIHVEIDSNNNTVYVSFKSPMTGGATDDGAGTGAATEYSLQIRKLREIGRPDVPPAENGTLVTLREGQREGPLLVQTIFPDRIEGVNFPEYPVAMEDGLPITLRVGEMASNGCTVSLTLLKIEDGSATFLKKVEEDRPCPICWYQIQLISGRQ